MFRNAAMVLRAGVDDALGFLGRRRQVRAGTIHRESVRCNTCDVKRCGPTDLQDGTTARWSTGRLQCGQKGPAATHSLGMRMEPTAACAR